MYAFSAADCISPAMERTKIFLFRPFKWSTFLKLCLVATITGGSGGSFNTSHNFGSAHDGGPSAVPHIQFTPALIAGIIAVSLLVIIVSFVIAYLITRLRFAYFHCLIHNLRQIAPGWRIYKDQATRFFWLNVVVGFGFLLALVLIAIPFAAGFWRLFRNMPAGGPPDWGALFSLLLPLIPILLVFMLAGIATDLILRDFMLPHYALENASAGQAWSAVWTRIGAEKGAFAVYALLRVILPIAVGLAIVLIVLLPGLLVFGGTALIEVALHEAFLNATGAMMMLGFFLKFIVGLIAFAIAVFVAICLQGPVSTWVRQFALLFYGGRYPALGDLLYPPLVAPVAPIVPVVPGTPGVV